MSLTLKNLRNLIHRLGGSVAPNGIPEEEFFYDLVSQSVEMGEPVESPVIAKDLTEFKDRQAPFQYFTSSLQNTVLIGSVKRQGVLLPIHYGSVSALILERKGSFFKVWRKPEILESVLLPIGRIGGAETIEHFRVLGLNVIDTTEPEMDYTAFREKAVKMSEAKRVELEEKLLKVWYSTFGGTGEMILTPGGLENHLGKEYVGSMVGVSDTFHNFSDSESDQIIMELNASCRSWSSKFATEGKDSTGRIGWYLRMRPNDNASSEFGLVRIEVDPSHSSGVDNIANKISLNVLKERIPVIHTDQDWDKRIYPLIECQRYLQKVTTTDETIKFFFGRSN